MEIPKAQQEKMAEFARLEVQRWLEEDLEKLRDENKSLKQRIEELEAKLEEK